MSTSMAAPAGRLWRVGAPPPPPPAQPPFVPPTAGYGAPPPGPRKQSPWLWVGLGCGCLLLLLVAGGVVGGMYYFGHRVEGQLRELQQQEAKPTPVPSTTDSDSTSTDAKPSDDSDTKSTPDSDNESKKATSAEQPSEDKAVAKALSQCEKDWVTRVVKHSEDWTTATIAVGPPQSEWAGEFDLKWNGSAYDIVAERGGVTGI